MRSVNLNFLDPATVDIAAHETDPYILIEPHAGEVCTALARRVGPAGSPCNAPGWQPATAPASVRARRN